MDATLTLSNTPAQTAPSTNTPSFFGGIGSIFQDTGDVAAKLEAALKAFQGTKAGVPVTSTATPLTSKDYLIIAGGGLVLVLGFALVWRMVK